MDSRREFLKKAALLSGAAGFSNVLPASIQRALAINPAPGSTYADAEHVVILMQENRSFDHCYGMLQGVRGFNDPRALQMPDKNKVWLQRNAYGDTYVPFRLNMRDTKATWMGSLPHSWNDQVDARNDGKYDKWLTAKQSDHPSYKNMPLTLGYYNREDLHFYYALADAFTICDQNFCSSMTGTTPNRLYLWSGTVREKQDESSQAIVRNGDLNYEKEGHWTTYPERLEDHGISWRIYQNELSLDVGFEGEENPWLANFTDNPIEWFEQYHVRFLPAYMAYLPQKIEKLKASIASLEEKLKATKAGSEAHEDLTKKLAHQQQKLAATQAEAKKYTPENFERLSAKEKNLHQKAFTTNHGDPDYHKVTSMSYHDGQTTREVTIPKGDILHQFREDVNKGKLPTVSWVVAPENFSDHPAAPWYGAWYVSEVMDILTKNEEVWKKTIFILCYDENDGYYDHVPPFVPPNPHKPHTGKVSEGIDPRVEYVTREQEMGWGKTADDARDSPIGLGYRVPLVIASPWSRGGAVNSEVFDHTSILQFLETFLEKKTGKQVKETNISSWRRAVCGDLTSVFKPYDGEKIKLPEVLEQSTFIEGIHKAQFKDVPTGYKSLTPAEVAQINKAPHSSPLFPAQEKGIRTACAIPYQVYVDGNLSRNRKTFEVTFESKKDCFGDKTAGVPMNGYAPGLYQSDDQSKPEAFRTWAYAIAAGDALQDAWPLAHFENEQYHLCFHGPNGFYRAFKGNANDPDVSVYARYERDKHKKLTGNLLLKFENKTRDPQTVLIKDEGYQKSNRREMIEPRKDLHVVVDLYKTHGWYDLTVTLEGAATLEKRYAGHVENGEASFTDPLMGGA